ncbi:transposase, IS605 family [Paenibacillus larvae subsp. larvae]|uniref:Transposase, IS605 family n=1 Tax=Paenibacillus larvae subsp. larvae TaxID=147375 RepID=A0A2L1U048_9BACL|nr:transposase, IS605 family [Paenibacillus larvae subsp. larvae]AVF31084.1 transposase, IS605 family [Paenibacillus larvae subsp. larvae]
MVNKAYKFRLYPTQEQEQLFAKTFGYLQQNAFGTKGNV